MFLPHSNQSVEFLMLFSDSNIMFLPHSNQSVEFLMLFGDSNVMFFASLKAVSRVSSVVHSASSTQRSLENDNAHLQHRVENLQARVRLNNTDLQHLDVDAIDFLGRFSSSEVS
jgi:uncharacterized protein YlxW (UPF0749 family)